MKVEIFSICDFAQAEPTGKLNILGAFDRIISDKEPISRSICAVAARIRFEQYEEGTKTVTLGFIDSDGQRIFPPLRAQFPVKVQPSENSIILNCVMVIPQIKFPKFGDYQVDLAIDDKVEAALPLFVRPRPS